MSYLRKLGEREYYRKVILKDFGSKKESKPLPFYPNPGSQSELFFDILGCEKGEQKIVDYKDGTEAIAYSVVPRPYTQEAKYILFRAGSRSGKSQCGAAYCYTMAQNYPDAVGLISANDYLRSFSKSLGGLAES
ncbi:hypothetical protein [Crocosphaera sp. Alani8]|uniref:hypothetical protein n=1 Tax=Crocosphaera sp. Alani8 TaxID=3038952 RepID=UPI00313DFA7A